MHNTRYDRNSSLGADRISGAVSRNHYYHFWSLAWCVILLGFGSISAALAQNDYEVAYGNTAISISGLSADINIVGSYPDGSKLSIELLGLGYNPADYFPLPNSDETSYLHEFRHHPVSRGTIYTSEGSPTNSFSYTATLKVKLLSAANAVLDQQEIVIGSESGQVTGGFSATSLVLDFNPVEQIWLSPLGNAGFPDGRPDTYLPEPPSEEHQQIIDDVIADGGFLLPWAAQEDGSLHLEIGDYSGSLDYQKGENLQFDIGVADGWDGKFKINGQEYDVDDLSSYMKDEFGNYGYMFDSEKAEKNKGVVTGANAKITQTGKGVVVVTYDNVDPEGNTLQQQVTFLTNRREAARQSINSDGVKEVTVADEPVSNDGNWDDEALISGLDAIEGQGMPEMHEAWTDDSTDQLIAGRDSATSQLEQWRNVRPFISSSLPRQTAYNVNISFGEFGTLNRNVDLGHPAVSVVRGITLAAFTYLLFASFLKKLTI